MDKQAIDEGIIAAADLLIKECYRESKRAGWWENKTTADIPRDLMLCVSELAEAMEGHRKGKMDTHLPSRPQIEVELADCLIRIFGMAGGYEYDVAGAIFDKLQYNRGRRNWSSLLTY